MATITGENGIVQVGSNTVAEIKGFSISTSANIFEDTELTDTDKTYKSGKKGWTAEMDCHFDKTDATGQEALVEGASVTLHLVAEGTGTGNIDYNGTALVSSVGIDVSDGSTVGRKISVQGSGALTRSVLP